MAGKNDRKNLNKKMAENIRKKWPKNYKNGLKNT